MKKIIFILFISIIIVSCKKPDGTLSGVVTYKQNELIGYKPDVGTKIYVTKFDCDSIKKALVAISQKEFIDELESRIQELYAYKDMDNVKSIIDSQQKHLEESREILNKYAKDSLDLDIKINRATVQLFEIITQQAVGTTSVDGTGKYTINLQPGEYNVIAISKSKSSVNVLEINGDINIKPATIMSEKISNLDFEF